MFQTDSPLSDKFGLERIQLEAGGHRSGTISRFLCCRSPLSPTFINETTPDDRVGRSPRRTRNGPGRGVHLRARGCIIRRHKLIRSRESRHRRRHRTSETIRRRLIKLISHLDGLPHLTFPRLPPPPFAYTTVFSSILSVFAIARKNEAARI